MGESSHSSSSGVISDDVHCESSQNQCGHCAYNQGPVTMAAVTTTTGLLPSQRPTTQPYRSHDNRLHPPAVAGQQLPRRPDAASHYGLRSQSAVEVSEKGVKGRRTSFNRALHLQQGECYLPKNKSILKYFVAYLCKCTIFQF